MNIQQAKQDIEQWLINFVEVNNSNLNGWPPCPYARAARLRGSIDIRIGIDPWYDLAQFSNSGIGNWEVVVFVYDPKLWDPKIFSVSVDTANQQFLTTKDLIALEDHPGDPEWVNGVCMNQGTWALVLCQRLTDLDRRASSLAEQNFYQGWPAKYLENLFRHRKNPLQ